MSKSRWNFRLLSHLFAGTLAALVVGCSSLPDAGREEFATGDKCQGLALVAAPNVPVEGLQITASRWIATGTAVETREGPRADLPSHCEVTGHFAEREGVIGGPYRIAFRMRLPSDWNGRFFFQGGGGSNGVVGDATGPNGAGNPLALERGYAVITQDSGHDNDRNNLADHGGELVFGHDPQARRDYGHSSLKPVYDLGRYLLRAYYGRDSEHEIFWGCSKGGQEGMAFAQRYPEAFDGIVAMAPGMSLPRAAVAQTWDTQAFAAIFGARGQTPTAGGFSDLFSAAQLGQVQHAILAACDGLDGTEDGVVAALGQCTTGQVLPELRKAQAGGADALSAAQVDALLKVMDGPRNSAGEALYAPWPWDAGIGTPGWNGWKLGNPGESASRNITLGGGSLAAVFTTPPTPLPFDPERLLAWQLAFDFDRDASRIYAVEAPFATSAWQDIGMRSTDLAAFRAHGSKLIVPHGSADPVFSVLDTVNWWGEVDDKAGGRASDFVRVFPVPGMNHCGGGPATDRFDSLAALEDWVVRGLAPASIPASAGEGTPWPGREMTLCPYPQITLADGLGNYRCGNLSTD